MAELGNQEKMMDLLGEGGIGIPGMDSVSPFQWSFPLGPKANRASRGSSAGMGQEYENIQCLISRGQREEAVAALEEFLRSFPGHSSAHDDLGVLYFEKGERRQASMSFLMALHADPKNWNAAKNLADLLVEQGERKEAFHFYKRVLAESPNDEEALLGVAVICEEEGLGEDADFFYRRVQEVRSINSIAPPPPQEPDDSAARRARLDSLPPEDSTQLDLTPTWMGKRLCRPPSALILRRIGESAFKEEEMEETVLPFGEIPVARPSSGASR